MNYVEHRFKARHQINVTAYLVWDGRLTETTATNVSQQGILVKTSSLRCPPNIKILVCCTIAGKFYEIAGTTIHNSDGNIGIEFNQLQTAFSQALIHDEQHKKVITAA